MTASRQNVHARLIKIDCYTSFNYVVADPVEVRFFDRYNIY
jgi:hypothetical protein